MAEVKPIPVRRIVVVDKRLQRGAAWLLAVTGAGMAAITGAILVALHRKVLGEVPLPAGLAASLANSGRVLVYAVVALVLFSGVVFWLVGLYVSHRIAGPVYAMSRYVADLATGHFPEIRPLRRHDELRDLFDGFQKAVEFLRAREVEDAFKLERAVHVFGPLAGSGEPKEVIDSLQALQTRKRTAAERKV